MSDKFSISEVWRRNLRRWKRLESFVSWELREILVRIDCERGFVDYGMGSQSLLDF